MTLPTFVNLITIALCGAVLVQCWRMMKALADFRAADFPATVTALEAATREAEAVLSDMRNVLAREAEPRLRAIHEGQAMAEELGVMIGIANATADRLLDASRTARTAETGLAA